MPNPQMPLTYEGVLELFRQTDQRFDQRMRQMAEDADQRMNRMAEETDRRKQELDRQFKETDRKISALGSRIGEIVENMIGGDIIPQFRALGYEILAHSRNLIFGNPGTSDSGEIDLVLYDGDIVILIEAKTNLKTEDVLDHIKRMEKYRRHIDRKGKVDNLKFIGAVAGAVVEPNVATFAQNQGLYVIVQSGKAVEIIPSPEGFTAKKW